MLYTTLVNRVSFLSLLVFQAFFILYSHCGLRVRAMDEEYAMDDSIQLLESASDFAYQPGLQNEASVKQFLDRFPLPVIINALQIKGDMPGLETALVACLEKVFKTKYGASLIPHYMSALLFEITRMTSASPCIMTPSLAVVCCDGKNEENKSFVQVGLLADSQAVRRLACKTVTCLLESFNDESVSATRLILEYDVYPLLLECLINGDEEVATASMEAIKELATSPGGMDLIFPAHKDVPTHLGNLVARSSSLGRVRLLALIVKLFSVSSSVASAIYNLNLLSLLEAEVGNTNDTLVTLSVLELLYELAEVQHGTEFLSRTSLIQLLSSIISNASIGSVLRSRAMMISGRLLSKGNIYMFIDQSSVNIVISAIDGRLALRESLDADECETALEVVGQIGSSIEGAVLLLASSRPAARHVVDVAFDRQGSGKQLAALHALGNISGETRPENNRVLNGDAEECLRRLIYETASKSTKLTPSGLFLSVLQQASEFRLAGYRMITGLVARPWCLMEICSKQEIINIVTDATTESTKIGMEARHSCCKAIHKAFVTSTKLISNPALTGIASKLQEAVDRGPYTGRKNMEAQPVVMTAERF